MKCDDTIDTFKYFKVNIDNCSPLFPFVEIVDDIDRGGNMELLNNWYQTKAQKIRDSYEEKKNKLIEEDKVYNLYNKIVETATKDLTKLLAENREKFNVNTHPGLEAKVKTNMEFRKDIVDGIEELERMKNNDLCELRRTFEIIDEHLQIATTFEEKEEILKRYNVLDKNGRLEK